MTSNGKNLVTAFISLALLSVVFTPIPIQLRTQQCRSDLSISQGYEWPMYRHDVNRSGNTLSPGLSAQPTTSRWQVETGDRVCSSPAVIDGKVYMCAGCDVQRTVLCLDMDTGYVIWNQTVGGTMCSSPAVALGKVYVGTLSGGVYCLEANTGQILWKYMINTGGVAMVSSPAVVDGKVFIGCYCFDADNGELLWRYPTDTWLAWESSPAVVGGRVYIGGSDCNVTCLDANTGSLIWNYTTDGPIWSSPAVVADRVYVGTREKGTVYCLDASEGRNIWSQTTVESSSIMSSTAVAYGNVYVGTEPDGRLFCMDAYTGDLKWVNDTKGCIHHSSPAVADGKVYVGANPASGPDSGGLYCFDAYSGDRLWRYDFAPSGYQSSSPIIAYGMIFIGCETSIFAFGTPTWPIEPKTWVVDDDGSADFHTIQEAINVAAPGDTVFVKAGTYRENLHVYRSLYVLGEDRGSTIVDGDNSSDVTEVTADNVTIKGFTIRNSGNNAFCSGISLVSDWNVISNNSLVNNSGRGLKLLNSHDNMITENEFIGNLQGIRLENSDNNTICLNRMTDNSNGLEIERSNYNSLSGNNITNNSDYSIKLHSSSNNSISGNNITDNEYGIGLLYCSNNTVFHNNFINNTFQVNSVNSTNVWDGGYLSGGNYWSDYNGTDANHDDMGDTPYIIDEDNIDTYPLIHLYVHILGDINDDRLVDIYDAILLEACFNSTPDDQDWNSNADFNNDSLIDICDAIILANNYGKTA